MKDSRISKGTGVYDGFGNALLDGKNFGQALGQGGLYGLMGGASGAAMGGLLDGIDAAIDGREFWSGKQWETVNEYILPDLGQGTNLPPRKQLDKTVGCTQETVKSMADYLGDPIPDHLNMTNGADLRVAATESGYKTATVGPSTAVKKAYATGGPLSVGKPSGITYNKHTMGINKIQIQMAGSRSKVIVTVMDPLIGGYRNISQSAFKHGIVRVIVGKISR